jgi:serine/threonine-protein kinase
VRAETLRQRLDRERRIPLAAARSICVALSEALNHAHGRGIIHRDVKPENIVLSGAGAVLLDFGIARAIEAAGTTQLTRSGIAVGTSAYMSPEQVQAATDIDHRTDLYSVGCVLFESLAGRPPFQHPNEVVVLQMHLNDPVPDIRTFRPETPAEVAEVVMKSLAKNRDDRWASAEGMATALG